MKNQNRGNAGFSLVEANLAILVVAVGLLSLFSLFPSGLRQSDLSQADTRQALFGDYALSRVLGNAERVKDWNSWATFNTFRDLVVDSGLKSQVIDSGAYKSADGSVGQLTGYYWVCKGNKQSGFPPQYKIVLGECTVIDINAQQNPVYGANLQDPTMRTVMFPMGPQRRFIWVQSHDKPTGTYTNNPRYYSEMIFTGM